MTIWFGGFPSGDKAMHLPPVQTHAGAKEIRRAPRVISTKPAAVAILSVAIIDEAAVAGLGMQARPRYI